MPMIPPVVLAGVVVYAVLLCRRRRCVHKNPLCRRQRPCIACYRDLYDVAVSVGHASGLPPNKP